MAAHAGGQVIDAVEVFQLGGLGFAAFHAVEQGQLAVQQGLAAAGDVEEDLVDAAAHVGLVHGGLYGGCLHLAERVAELAYLVAAVLQRRGFRVHVDGFAAPEPADDRGQAFVGHLQGLAAQPDQAAHDGAADPEGHHDRHDDGGQAEQARESEPEQDGDGDRAGVLGEGVGCVELERAQLLGRRVVCGLPGVLRNRGCLTGSALGEQSVLQLGEPAERGAVAQLLVGAPVAFGQVGNALAEQEAGGADRLQQLDPARRVQLAGFVGPGEQRVDPAEVLLTAADGGQRPDLPVDLLVAERGGGREHLEAGVDDAVVEVLRAHHVDIPGVDVAAGFAEPLEVGDDLADARLKRAAGRAPGLAADRVHGSAGEVGGGAVGDGALGGERRRIGLGVGQIGDRKFALALKLAHEDLARIANRFEQRARRQQVDRRACGDCRCEGPERQQCDQGDHYQRNDLRTDRPTPGSHQTPPERVQDRVHDSISVYDSRTPPRGYVIMASPSTTPVDKWL